MSKLEIIDLGGGQFVVDGDLTFASIDKKIVKSFDFLNTTKLATIDFSHVTCTDSAGLALMIEWIKYTRQHRIQLRFKNIPEQLRKLAKLSGFDSSSYFATAD